MSGKWEDFTFANSPMRRQIKIEGPNITTRVVQDNIVECLDKNMAEHNEYTDGKFNDPSGYTKVASIPMWLLEKWKAEEDIDWYRWNEDDKVRILQKLNDVEYLKLRTRKGTI